MSFRNHRLLKQMRPSDCAPLVRDYPGEVVRIAGRHCSGAGQYQRAGLAQRFGPAAGLPEVLDLLAADCPRHGVGQFSDPCGARFPDLVPKG